MEGLENPTRLGVQDKRVLFYTLIAMVDRLLFLNKFPVNQADFALSCQPPEVEAAWRLLGSEKTTVPALSFSDSNFFKCHDRSFLLHLYPDDTDQLKQGYGADAVFMNLPAHCFLEIPENNRFKAAVEHWAQRQIRLEDQILRADKVIKAITHSCNTVGQYKRVSPDLLTFLPAKYKDALKDYTKKSPYPAITVKPEEIETTMATLAYSSLQPIHSSEKEYSSRPKWGHRMYGLKPFPRTNKFTKSRYRSLEL